MRRELLRQVRMGDCIRLLFIFLIAIAILSCGCIGQPLQDVDISETVWELVSYRNETGMQAVIEETSITAVFGKDGSLSGSAGCNQYSATYAARGQTLTISDIAWTEMYCLFPEGIMRQETEYLTALKNTTQFGVSDQELIMWGEEETPLLEFTALK